MTTDAMKCDCCGRTYPTEELIKKCPECMLEKALLTERPGKTMLPPKRRGPLGRIIEEVGDVN